MRWTVPEWAEENRVLSKESSNGGRYIVQNGTLPAGRMQAGLTTPANGLHFRVQFNFARGVLRAFGNAIGIADGVRIDPEISCRGQCQEPEVGFTNGIYKVTIEFIPTHVGNTHWF